MKIFVNLLLSKMLQGLLWRAVVTEGTAREGFCRSCHLPVAGKTGTAHVSDGAIKYAHGVYQATFVGYFPAEKPQYHLHSCYPHKTSCGFTLWWHISCAGV
ncbi:MAG: penicillin-binding transpeptidase domain-containing protein [Chitinophagaceae bacterium]